MVDQVKFYRSKEDPNDSLEYAQEHRILYTLYDIYISIIYICVKECRADTMPLWYMQSKDNHKDVYV